MTFVFLSLLPSLSRGFNSIGYSTSSMFQQPECYIDTPAHAGSDSLSLIDTHTHTQQNSNRSIETGSICRLTLKLIIKA